MKILDRLSVLASVFGATPGGRVNPVAAEVSKRWMQACTREPELACDLIREGGLMAVQPVEMENGAPQVAPLDPYRLAYEAGRRDLALLLLAQAGISITELNHIMEADNVRD